MDLGKIRLGIDIFTSFWVLQKKPAL